MRPRRRYCAAAAAAIALRPAAGLSAVSDRLTPFAAAGPADDFFALLRRLGLGDGAVAGPVGRRFPGRCFQHPEVREEGSPLFGAESGRFVAGADALACALGLLPLGPRCARHSGEPGSETGQAAAGGGAGGSGGDGSVFFRAFVVRTLGNDLPPLHGVEQTARNFEHILEEENMPATATATAAVLRPSPGAAVEVTGSEPHAWFLGGRSGVDFAGVAYDPRWLLPQRCQLGALEAEDPLGAAAPSGATALSGAAGSASRNTTVARKTFQGSFEGPAVKGSGDGSICLKNGEGELERAGGGDGGGSLMPSGAGVGGGGGRCKRGRIVRIAFSRVALLNRVLDDGARGALQQLLAAAEFRAGGAPRRGGPDALPPPWVRRAATFHVPHTVNLMREATVLVHYATNVNRARNWGVQEAIALGATWVLALDSNLFVTQDSYARIVRALVEAELNNKTYLLNPYYRLAVRDNREINSLRTHDALRRLTRIHEAQLSVRSGAPWLFSVSNTYYGKADKIQLIEALAAYARAPPEVPYRGPMAVLQWKVVKSLARAVGRIFGAGRSAATLTVNAGDPRWCAQADKGRHGDFDTDAERVALDRACGYLLRLAYWSPSDGAARTGKLTHGCGRPGFGCGFGEEASKLSRGWLAGWRRSPVRPVACREFGTQLPRGRLCPRMERGLGATRPAAQGALSSSPFSGACRRLQTSAWKSPGTVWAKRYGGSGTSEAAVMQVSVTTSE